MDLIPDIIVEEPKLLAQSVAAELENAIVYGDLPEGYKLNEEVVVQKTGVSRSPVREALRLLERDGLVTREPRRGVRVSPLSVKELDELYLCRLPLELMAAQLSCQNGTDDELDEIRSAHERCVAMAAAGDIRNHFRSNVRMSQLIFEAGHNQTLIRLMTTIHKQALRYRYIAYQQSPETRATSVERNARLVEALLARDVETALDTMRENFNSAQQFIRQSLSTRPDASAPTHRR